MVADNFNNVTIENDEDIDFIQTDIEKRNNFDNQLAAIRAINTMNLYVALRTEIILRPIIILIEVLNHRL